MHWNPFEDLERMHTDMDRIFNRMFRSRNLLPEHTGKSTGERVRMPVCSIDEKGNKVVASFELPGVDKKDIELNVTDTHVEVKVQKKAEKEVKKKDRYSYAAHSQQFYRAVPLPAEVNAQQAKARYKDGVLTVEVPAVKSVDDKHKIRIE